MEDELKKLDYQVPTRPRVSEDAKFVAAMIGFVFGFGACAAAGCAGLEFWTPRGWAVLFFVLAIAGAFSAVKIVGGKRQSPAAAGLVLGVVVCALCEGICYTALASAGGGH